MDKQIIVEINKAMCIGESVVITAGGTVVLGLYTGINSLLQKSALSQHLIFFP